MYLIATCGEETERCNSSERTLSGGIWSTDIDVASGSYDGLDSWAGFSDLTDWAASSENKQNQYNLWIS